MKTDDGWKRSPETRAKLREAAKLRWADPEFRAKLKPLSENEHVKRAREYVRAWRAQFTPEEAELQLVARRERVRKRRERKRRLAQLTKSNG
jgi:hypothetical protein